jgi:hypothetical protein
MATLTGQSYWTLVAQVLLMDFICVERCQNIVTTVTIGVAQWRVRGLGGDLEARPVSSSRGLRILGSMRALVSPSDSILVSLLLCFQLEHFIIYVSFFVTQEFM